MMRSSGPTSSRSSVNWLAMMSYCIWMKLLSFISALRSGLPASSSAFFMKSLKESGFGKEGPAYAIEEMTELKMVVFHLSS